MKQGAVKTKRRKNVSDNDDDNESENDKENLNESEDENEDEKERYSLSRCQFHEANDAALPAEPVHDSSSRGGLA